MFIFSSANHEYDDFLEDLEEDADLRQNVNVYKVAKFCYLNHKAKFCYLNRIYQLCLYTKTGQYDRPYKTAPKI